MLLVEKTALCSIVLCWAIASPAEDQVCQACDNPVYRYALENWTPGDYELLLIRVNELSASESAAWSDLEQRVPGTGAAKANLKLRQVASQELADAYFQGVRQSLGKVEANCLILLSPAAIKPRRLIWQGECTSDNIQLIRQSPAREELARRLVGGEAGIWVWLDESSSRQGSSARKRLEELLIAYIAAEASKPSEKPAAADKNASAMVKPADAAVEKPPRFSVLSLSADDPKEFVFVAMLQATAPGKPDSPAPVAYPVFGRGRVLPGIGQRDLNAACVRSTGDFLNGPCSCQIKEMNPGMDLLLAADWSSVAPGASPAPLFSLLALEPEDSPQVDSSAQVGSNSSNAGPPQSAEAAKLGTADGVLTGSSAKQQRSLDEAALLRERLANTPGEAASTRPDAPDETSRIPKAFRLVALGIFAIVSLASLAVWRLAARS